MTPRSLGFASAAAVAALALLAAAGQAEARWRVVGPGIAVTEAEEGTASLAIECENGLVLAAYSYAAGAPGGPATLRVDDREFELTASGAAARLTLAEGDDGRLSAELRRTLEEGRLVTLAAGGPAANPLRFSLAGSREAIAAVARACE